MKKGYCCDEKIIDAPEQFVPEMLEGIYAAHPQELECVDGDAHRLRSRRKHPGKAGIATGGGGGHLPLFPGRVGQGMRDGCSIGDVFQSPSAGLMPAATQAMHQGAGAWYIHGSDNGGIFNFNMARMEENIRALSVVAGEDVASAAPVGPGEPNKRRGVAGIFFMCKCANVRNGRGATLRTAPGVGKPGFQIGEDEMETGMGIYGWTRS